DEEWGVPVRDDQRLFELLILEGAQAGLSWITVLRKRERYREVFHGFEPDRVARMQQRRLETLLKDPGIIRNRLKVESTVDNAKRFLAVQRECGSFAEFLWEFVAGVPQQNNPMTSADLPSRTPTSDRLSRALKQRGFRFVGTTICYAYMQAAGLVNDHLVGCPRHRALGGTRDRTSAERTGRRTGRG